MRLAVSGTHCSGKTTLVNWIHKEFQIPKIDEIATELFQTEYNFEEVHNDINLFFNLERTIINKQIEKENDLKDWGFVVDRSLLDTICYLKEKLSTYKKENFLLEDYKKLYEKIKNHMCNYDFIFLLRGFENIENNGYRKLDYYHSSVIESIIFDEHIKISDTVKVFGLDGNLETRKKQIKSLLNIIK